MRILFDPEPPSGGGGGPAPNPAPQAPAPPPTISLSPEEYQRLREVERGFAELQRTRQAELDAKERERLKALADKEGAEKALDEQRKSWEGQVGAERQRYSTLEQRWLGSERNAVINDALAGRKFSGATDEVRRVQAAQLRAIMEPLLETTLDASGVPIVREKGTGRPGSEALKAQLDSPSFAHFFAPGSTGGSGADATRPAVGGSHPYADNPNPPGSVAWHAFNLKKQAEMYPSFGLALAHPPRK